MAVDNCVDMFVVIHSRKGLEIHFVVIHTLFTYCQHVYPHHDIVFVMSSMTSLKLISLIRSSSMDWQACITVV